MVYIYWMGWMVFQLIDFDYFEIGFGYFVIWVGLGFGNVFLVCFWCDVFFW